MEHDIIITNNQYMASFIICCSGWKVIRIGRNRRHRISFVIEGEGVRNLRDAFNNNESVVLNVRSYIETLKLIRHKMDEIKRSAVCQKLYPMQIQI